MDLTLLTPIVEQNYGSLWWFRPELALCGGSLALLVLDLAWRVGSGRRARLAVAALLVLGAAGALLRQQPPGMAFLFNGMIASDAFATFFKWLFLAAGAVTVVVAAIGDELAP